MGGYRHHTTPSLHVLWRVRWWLQRAVVTSSCLANTLLRVFLMVLRSKPATEIWTLWSCGAVLAQSLPLQRASVIAPTDSTCFEFLV